jgi:hypothetical protein
MSDHSIAPRLLHSQGNSYCYPLDKRLRGPNSRYASYGLEKILASVWYLTPVLNSLVCRYTDLVDLALLLAVNG